MAEQAASRPADWELAKENIQPLKQGRKMAKLINCLQVLMIYHCFWGPLLTSFSDPDQHRYGIP
jgi:hypothetical protein